MQTILKCQRWYYARGWKPTEKNKWLHFGYIGKADLLVGDKLWEQNECQVTEEVPHLLRQARLWGEQVGHEESLVGDVW